MAPATLSFIVDREWAAAGVTGTLRIVNGTSAAVTLESFEIRGAALSLDDAAQSFSFEATEAAVSLAAGDTYRLGVVFKSSQATSVVARVVVKVREAAGGELEAALFGKTISF
jgi:hypothetical protein